MRAYAGKVELIASGGQHLRYLPGALAKALVETGTGEVSNANGKVKAIRLIASAETHALRIGEATALLPLNTCFTRRVKSEGCTWYEHHPRALYGWE